MASSCADYSNVTTPAAGFDRQTGTGTGTLDGVPGAYFEWTFVDGGPGGVPDSPRSPSGGGQPAPVPELRTW